MNDLEELCHFLYIGSSLDLCNIIENKNKLLRINSIVSKLITEKQGAKVLTEITAYYDYFTSLFPHKAQSNLEVLTILLASCSLVHTDPELTHTVYQTLLKISWNPSFLFSFEYFRKFLMISHNEFDSKNIISKYYGKGMKKAINYWYNQFSEFDLLCMLTEYRSSHLWTNKDLFKFYHVKPHNEGTNLIFKYVMFGYSKVKNDAHFKEYPDLKSYIEDLESLKSTRDEVDAVRLIKKNGFKLGHLPNFLWKSYKVWSALTEKISYQKFCELIHVFCKNSLIAEGSDLESIILELIDLKNEEIKQTNPMYSCMAIQVYDKLSQRNTPKSLQQTSIISFNTPTSERTVSSYDASTVDSPHLLSKFKGLLSTPQSPVNSSFSSWKSVGIREGLWKAFLSSVEYHRQILSPLKLTNLCLVIEKSRYMKHLKTHRFECLSPLEVSSCVILSMRHMYQESNSLDIFVVSNEINQLTLTDIQDFESTEKALNNIPQGKDNPLTDIFKRSICNKKSYDAFIFLTAKDSKNNQLKAKMEEYRSEAEKPNSKLVCVNLSKKRSNKELECTEWYGTKLNLKLTGWNYDYNFMIDSFIRDKF